MDLVARKARDELPGDLADLQPELPGGHNYYALNDVLLGEIEGGQEGDQVREGLARGGGAVDYRVAGRAILAILVAEELYYC